LSKLAFLKSDNLDSIKHFKDPLPNPKAKSGINEGIWNQVIASMPP
jgi:hypothetical protein